MGMDVYMEEACAHAKPGEKQVTINIVSTTDCLPKSKKK